MCAHSDSPEAPEARYLYARMIDSGIIPESEWDGESLLFLQYANVPIDVRNKAAALRLYELSAEGGYYPAITAVGHIYRFGIEGYIEKSDEEALEWYMYGARLGFGNCEYLVGRMYYNGIGIDKSEEEGIRWFKKAASHGNEDAKNVLDAMDVLNNQGEDMSLYSTETLNIMKQALDGSAASYTSMGQHFEKGIGAPKNIQRAALWYREGMKLGDPLSYVFLGDLYKTGKGVEKSIEKALDLYTSAAKMRGGGIATKRLGEFYITGPPEYQSEELAIKWLSKMATDFDNQKYLQILADGGNQRAKYVLEHALDVQIEALLEDDEE